MRVISGKYKGRKLKGYDIVGTRPTMDRVKESMFAMIQNKIKGSIVLDLFSGSGALGIEAISNGARSCVFVDIGDIPIKTLKENISNLKITEDYRIMKMDYNDALHKLKDEKIKFDLIFLDPPYKNNYLNQILDDIIKFDLLNENGYIICECENIELFNEHLQIYKNKKYGDKEVIIYIKK